MLEFLMRSVSCAPQLLKPLINLWNVTNWVHHPNLILYVSLFLSEEAEYWYFTWAHGHTMNPYGVAILCSMFGLITWEEARNFRNCSWISSIYMKRSRLFSPALLLFKLWLVQSSWEISTNKQICFNWTTFCVCSSRL